MSAIRRLSLALKAARQLGPRQAGWYALYQSGLHAGLWRARTPTGEVVSLRMPVRALFTLPDPGMLEQVMGEPTAALLAEAGAIAAGRFRAYGGEFVPIDLTPPGPRQHWTAAERSLPAGVDIKDLWEPARFGWVYTLGRAYRLTDRDEYAAAFWQHLETFFHANPPNTGIYWASGQEVALRLLALLYAAQVFAGAPTATQERTALLAGALAAHSARIPPTLSYAKAQHNNHLISEGLGLLLAGCALPDHPQSDRWRTLGRRTLDTALLQQIRPDGVYAQHSLNYHRLVLHAALIYDALVRQRSLNPMSAAVQARLRAATTWLLAQVDPTSGYAPNYGHHDGANILPLAAGGWNDMRPTAQAAARAFLHSPVFPPGPWDELCLWLGLPVESRQVSYARASSPAVHRLGDAQSWAILRAEQYASRPAHADQLHVDLWWRGMPVTLDAGTFRYNAEPPWQNALAGTLVHNTVTVAGRDQMLRAGRFLWLDWAQARLEEVTENRLAAVHDGYQRIGVVHRRVLNRRSANHWLVEDELLSSNNPSGGLIPFRLHWLLPDAPYALDGAALQLTLPAGRVTLRLTLDAPAGASFEIALARAGQSLAGPPPGSPVVGWFSPTYGVKQPALSLSLLGRAPAPVRLVSEFIFD